MDSKILAKRAVNGVTALGGAISAVSLYFAFQGWAHTAWILMGVAVVIDALDGTVVRLLGLDETLPRYDGARLDEYADLVTFVVAPVGFAWASGMLPFTWLGLATGMAVVTVSSLQFSRVDNKTEHAFWGWPSYWNIAYFYAWALEISSVWVILVSLVLCIGVFLPVPFAYPSKLPRFQKPMWALGGLWGAVLFSYLAFPDLSTTWLWVSLVYPAIYLGLSASMWNDLA